MLSLMPPWQCLAYQTMKGLHAHSPPSAWKKACRTHALPMALGGMMVVAIGAHQAMALLRLDVELMPWVAAAHP